MKQAEAERLLAETEREAKLRANRLLAERRRREKEAKAAAVNAPVNGILKHKHTDSSTNFVTLTQEQLSAILNTLSKVQGSSNEVNLDVGE